MLIKILAMLLAGFGFLFIPCYAFNEWILLGNGLGLISSGTFVDTGGSIVIHAFGAIFGIGVIMTMTTKKDIDLPGVNKGSQMAGIGITVLLAVSAGFIAGKIISTFGRKTQPYDDIDEFEL
jgi:ammonium transporter Rh